MSERLLNFEYWLGEGLFNLGILFTDGRDTCVTEKAKINILHMTEHN